MCCQLDLACSRTSFVQNGGQLIWCSIGTVANVESMDWIHISSDSKVKKSLLKDLYILDKANSSDYRCFHECVPVCWRRHAIKQSDLNISAPYVWKQ